ncbi:MAG: DUF4876 domain-containing protein [Ignavibacteriaceae bacterium]
MKKVYLYLVPILIFINGCEENPPIMVEGNTHLRIEAYWHSVPADSTSELLPLRNAKVILSSMYGMMIHQADINGCFEIKGIPSAVYSISFRMVHPEDESIQLVYNKKDVMIISGTTVSDSVIAKPITSSGIAINEIYSVGPVNSIYFFFDQYIELYNMSDSIKYLDGMMVMRFSGNSDGQGPGADEYGDGHIQGATYIFKFPGSPGEKNHPFYPNTFLVLASDAVNHKNTVATSIDLSTADWEFYNQYSPQDIDNPNVPNLINMKSESTVDFLISLTGDVIIVSSGVDSVWQDGIDITTVIDGVEYQSSANLKKTLDDRVDRGFSYSPPKYSGQSMRRREPGMDTNDATLDWEIIPQPTPGYH